ncbi:hypothetical protein DMC30DRAFT_404760 [Rhodotorula diobovata]|uniref:Uncharacterized protein n=1 Tax=Rhodotorula diobovata TaxID=5288 RepID=A0A5C5FNN5_9BASI|nr:hypothetical protein DMC30DRAFT_404760 [Rhodotorula diobovata]
MSGQPSLLEQRPAAEKGGWLRARGSDPGRRRSGWRRAEHAKQQQAEERRLAEAEGMARGMVGSDPSSERASVALSHPQQLSSKNGTGGANVEHQVSARAREKPAKGSGLTDARRERGGATRPHAQEMGPHASCVPWSQPALQATHPVRLPGQKGPAQPHVPRGRRGSRDMAGEGPPPRTAAPLATVWLSGGELYNNEATRA